MYLLSPGKGREEKGREGKRWKKRVTFLFEPFNVFAFSREGKRREEKGKNGKG